MAGFITAAASPNLEPRGKASWPVFACAYFAAISLRVRLTFRRVGRPKTRVNVTPLRAFLVAVFSFPRVDMLLVC